MQKYLENGQSSAIFMEIQPITGIGNGSRADSPVRFGYSTLKKPMALKPKQKATKTAPEPRHLSDLKDRFCSTPFEQLVAHNEGTAQTCCQAWLPYKVGNLNKQSVAEVWNSPQMMLIRASILDGSYSFCKKNICPHIQGKTLPLRDKVQDPELREIIDKRSLALNQGPKILALTGDRSCNLSCPSCRVEKIMLTSGPEYKKIRTRERDVLEQALPGLKRLIVSGSADPFGSKIYREILTSLDGSKYPELKIQLLTNGQLLTPRMWEKLEKIHGNIDKIQVSFDAARPETYAVLRRGGRLAPLMENVRFLAALKREGAGFFLQLDFVVQKLNYREMPEFVMLGKSFAADLVYFQKIVNWGTYRKKEYFSHAVYRKDHPEYQEFLKVMKNPILRDPRVQLGNLTEFI